MSIKKLKLVTFFVIINFSSVFSQDYKVYNFEEFQSLLHQKNDKVYVINFWATWSGAIPATLIYNRNSRTFFERSFTFSELEKEILIFYKKRFIRKNAT